MAAWPATNLGGTSIGSPCCLPRPWPIAPKTALFSRPAACQCPARSPASVRSPRRDQRSRNGRRASSWRYHHYHRGTSRHGLCPRATTPRRVQLALAPAPAVQAPLYQLGGSPKCSQPHYIVHTGRRSDASRYHFFLSLSSLAVYKVISLSKISLLDARTLAHHTHIPTICPPCPVLTKN